MSARASLLVLLALVLPACPAASTESDADASSDTGVVPDTGIDVPPPPPDTGFPEDVPVTPMDAGDPCRTSSDCASCTARAGCGWCGPGLACRSGTAGGSADGTCTGASWAWVSASCTTDPPADVPAIDAGTCGAGTDCSSCAALAGCGWCRPQGRCLPGTSSGAGGTTCAGPDWAWVTSMCTPDLDAGECGSSGDCAACAARSGCGWCGPLGRCLPGTASGASIYACSGASWAWLGTQCAAATDAGSDLCRTSSDCASCAARAGCGWCKTSRTCVAGSAEGSTAGGCTGTSWAWLGSQCTAPPGDGGASPCGSVSPGGQCLSPATGYQVCIVPPVGTPRVETVRCSTGEACQLVGGVARCVLTAACREGESQCTSGRDIRRCVGGRWTPMTCPGTCVTVGAGATCASTSPGRTITGRVQYQLRRPNSGRTDWGAVETAPARGFEVVSMDGTTPFAAAVTSLTDGSFSIMVPATVDASDRLVITAIFHEGAAVAYAAVNPSFSPGEHRTAETYVPRSPSLWSWSWRIDSLPTGPFILTINEASGSGPASVFDRFGVAYRDTRLRYGRAGMSLGIWMGPGVEWDCGSCFADIPFLSFGSRFSSQMHISMGADLSYYSEAVALHESGHWVMSSFGKAPGEFGTHSSSCRSYPGLAWSEGWATWFGQSQIGSPIYYDKGSSFWWYDMSVRAAPSSSPTATDVESSTVPGLLQTMSEREVGMILWRLSGGSANRGPLFTALASPRMTERPGLLSGYERGYSMHIWTSVDLSTCTYRNVIDLVVNPVPVLPDFLDALNCAGFPRTTLGDATEPTRYYPYPTTRPLCR